MSLKPVNNNPFDCCARRWCEFDCAEDCPYRVHPETRVDLKNIMMGESPEMVKLRAIETNETPF